MALSTVQEKLRIKVGFQSTENQRMMVDRLADSQTTASGKRIYLSFPVPEIPDLNCGFLFDFWCLLLPLLHPVNHPTEICMLYFNTGEFTYFLVD